MFRQVLKKSRRSNEYFENINKKHEGKAESAPPPRFQMGTNTDTVIYFSDQHLTWLSQLKPNAKVG